MGNIDKALKWMDDRHRHKPNAPTYSMNRRGNTEDCSSSVYKALKYAGWKSNINYIGNTETLYREPNLKEIYNYNDVRRGDIFIRGVQGRTLGAGGHTGFFYKKNGIVHCNYSNNGISYNDMSSYLTYFLDRKRSNRERYFRPIFPNTPQQKTYKGKNAYKIKDEFYYGTFANVVNVRTAPSTSAKIIAQYYPQQIVYYDQVWYGDGYRWLSYRTKNGRRYVAYRPENNPNIRYIIIK